VSGIVTFLGYCLGVAILIAILGVVGHIETLP
jgi:hypothetical protein